MPAGSVMEPAGSVPGQGCLRSPCNTHALQQPPLLQAETSGSSDELFLGRATRRFGSAPCCPRSRKTPNPSGVDGDVSLVSHVH